ncbi:hypothetical protein LAY57_24725 [Argonema antarcticum A004/B2]|nr:hypothetical protein [Argonema antarcticum A004/B2]
MVSGQWSVVSCQWSVVSCQWSVVSGQLSVVSGQWSVVSSKNQDFQSNHWQFLVVSYFRHPALERIQAQTTISFCIMPIYTRRIAL